MVPTAMLAGNLGDARGFDATVTELPFCTGAQINPLAARRDNPTPGQPLTPWTPHAFCKTVKPR